MTDLDQSLREAMKPEPLQTDSQESQLEEKPESGQEQVAPESKPEGSEEEIKPFAEKPVLTGKTAEELEEIYSNWNKTYTKTRQQERAELRAAQKELEELRQKVQSVETQSQRDIVSPDLERTRDQVQKDFDLGNMSVQDYTAYMTDLAREEARRTAQETFKTLQKEQAEEQYQNKALEAFMSDETLNPDSPTYDETKFIYMQQHMANAMDAYMQSNNGSAIGFDYMKHINETKTRYDEYINGLVSSRVKTSSEAARAKAKETGKTAVGGNTQTTVGGKQSLESMLKANMRG